MRRTQRAPPPSESSRGTPPSRERGSELELEHRILRQLVELHLCRCTQPPSCELELFHALGFVRSALRREARDCPQRRENRSCRRPPPPWPEANPQSPDPPLNSRRLKGRRRLRARSPREPSPEGRPRRRCTRCRAKSSTLLRRESLSGYSTSPYPSRYLPVRWLNSG